MLCNRSSPRSAIHKYYSSNKNEYHFHIKSDICSACYNCSEREYLDRTHATRDNPTITSVVCVAVTPYIKSDICSVLAVTVPRGST
jgi:hypothetical protein